MYKYGSESRRLLATCDERLQRVFNEAIYYMDIKILEGNRPKTVQDRYYEEGRTKVKWPHGTHNLKPSGAVDAVPFDSNATPNINWEDRERFSFMAGIIIGVGLMMGISIRWGGDWNRDGELDDNKFDDLPHFELLR